MEVINRETRRYNIVGLEYNYENYYWIKVFQFQQYTSFLIFHRLQLK